MRVCSLFSGIGGIDLGFIQAGFEIVWANEFDEDAARTYRYNFKDCNLVVKNIKNYFSFWSCLSKEAMSIRIYFESHTHVYI